MNPEILKRIDVLAAKLGTTASQVWEILLKQAKVEAYVDLAWIVAGSVGGYFGFKLAIWGHRKFSEASWSTEDRYIWAMVGGWAMAGLGAISAVGSLSAVWTPLLNPQYWALQQILSIFSGK